MADLKLGVFTIGGTKPGEPLIKASLLVAEKGEVAGAGRFSWVVSPPKLFGVTFVGVTHSTGLGPAEQLYALNGTAFPNLMGASNVPVLSITLDGIWGATGKASFSLWNDTPQMKTFENIPVSVTWAD